MAEQPPSARGTIEIELEGRAPAGVLTGADDLRFPFRGWTELGSVIEQWRACERQRGRARRHVGAG